MRIARREFLTKAAAGLLGGLAAGRAAVLPAVAAAAAPTHTGPHAGNMTVGDVDLKRLGFDPLRFIRSFDWGKASALPNGRTVREYTIVASERDIEIAPGVFFPAWVFNGTVPGPTLRAREGDLLRIKLINASKHPHTLHFHGIHKAEMDGVPGIGRGDVLPGESFTYEFDATPFGLHLYHCHSLPLKRHIHKGLYGVFIVDPKTPRAQADELIMVMNGFDTNFDADNEVYAVNTVAHHFMHEPIKVEVGKLVRMYLVNLTEFDLINSLHLHGMFFDVFRTGTRPAPDDHTDTVMLCQGERAVLETTFRYPGKFMFHAHQSEFAELGWMGLFEATGARRDT